jgi:hypothetical protein
MKYSVRLLFVFTACAAGAVYLLVFSSAQNYEIARTLTLLTTLTLIVVTASSIAWLGAETDAPQVTTLIWYPPWVRHALEIGTACDVLVVWWALSKLFRWTRRTRVGLATARFLYMPFD